MIAEKMVDWVFGKGTAPKRIDLALFVRDSEVKDPGYKRVGVQKGAWRIASGAASTAVEFGPFIRSVRFDRVVFADGRDVIHEDVFGAVEVPAGTTFEYEPTLSTVD